MLEKAIRAHGGEANLRKLQSVSWKINEKSSVVPGAVTILEIREDGVTRYRTRMEHRLGTMVLPLAGVVDGEKGWLQLGEAPTQAMTPDELAEFQCDIYHRNICKLLPLRDAAYQLTAVKDETIDGRPAQGIRVGRQGRSDVLLYFDKATSLLVKCGATRKGKDEELHDDFIYSDHKACDGVVVAHKVAVLFNGKLMSEQTVTEVRVAERFGPEAFAKP